MKDNYKFGGLVAASIAALFLLVVPGTGLAASGNSSPTLAKSTPVSRMEKAMKKADERSDRYWQMEKERLTAARDHLKAKVEAYQKTNKEETEQSLKQSDEEYRAQIQAIDKKYEDVLVREKMAVGADQKRLDAERQEYLDNHPDTKADIAQLQTEIENLESQQKAEEAKKKDSEENYWKMEVERLQAAKKHYSDEVATYQKNLSSTDTAADIRSLEARYKTDIENINKKYEAEITREKMAVGNEQKEMETQRQDYLNSHPDLKKQVDGLHKDIDGLMKKVDQLKPKTVGRAG